VFRKSAKEKEGKSKLKPVPVAKEPVKSEGEEDKDSEAESGGSDSMDEDDGPWLRQQKPLFDPKIDITPMVGAFYPFCSCRCPDSPS